MTTIWTIPRYAFLHVHALTLIDFWHDEANDQHRNVPSIESFDRWVSRSTSEGKFFLFYFSSWEVLQKELLVRSLPLNGSQICRSLPNRSYTKKEKKNKTWTGDSPLKHVKNTNDLTRFDIFLEIGTAKLKKRPPILCTSCNVSYKKVHLLRVNPF